MIKVISLSDEAYATLRTLKRPKDSFSDVVIRLTESERKKFILSLAGSWAGDEKEAKKILEELMKNRKGMKFRKVRF